MLTSAFRTLVQNPIKKKASMGKEKKKVNVLTVFFISHKNDVKTFFNQIVNQCPKGTCQHFPKNNSMELFGNLIKNHNNKIQWKSKNNSLTKSSTTWKLVKLNALRINSNNQIKSLITQLIITFQCFQDTQGSNPLPLNSLWEL